ncbi:flavin-containing monooxygenase 5-like [Tachypleus tridentatus]|uniref:flavin-containing monooxygenase 5-like n=1 Tax=Tachypleus tridentatus TaxID=6853 RepID=UPI003FCF1475
MAETRRICIIGAGSSGLTSIKACLEEGLQPFCYEKTDQIGGLWRYRDDDFDGVASVMKSTIINTSKEINAYSDFPPPKEFPNYMHNNYMIKYIEMYAEKFDLARYVRFRHEILKVVENHDFGETGRWKVAIRNIEEDRIFDDVFDGVLVCIGHHVYPHVPTFPGMEKFKGKILHTHSYKKPDGFSDKKIVIVGVGNSGGDVAVELSQITDKVYLSTRNGCWINYRVGSNGMPLDVILLRRSINWLFNVLPYSTICNILEKQVNSKMNHDAYCLKPKYRILGQHPMVNDALPNRILSGTVVIKGNIKEFTENGVIFEGEEEECKVDIVILATGYKIKFPFLDDEFISVNNNKVELFKYVIPPKLKHPSLAIIGLVQPLGSILPISELQARWVTRLITKRLKLPPLEDMMTDIRQKTEFMTKRYFASPRHTIQVDWINYMDEIASLLKVKPNLPRLLVTDPLLFWKCFSGPCATYQYRLNGPHAWPGARNAIMTCMERVLEPLKTRPFNHSTKIAPSGGIWNVLVIATLAVLLAFLYKGIFG